MADRLAHEDEIEAQLGAWTREREPAQVMHALQSLGLPAGVVQRSSESPRSRRHSLGARLPF